MKYQKTKQLGNLKITATSEVHLGEILDTKIEIDGGVLCWVAGNECDEFIDKIQALIIQYRI